MKNCKRCFVSGRVQGVFFRAAARDRAQSLGITGHARNLDDGRVEVLACGDKAQLAVFIDWLWEGSRLASVESVDVHDANDKAPLEFTTD